MRYFSSTHKKGFTLIEMLVYLAILILATTTVVMAFLSLRTLFERNKSERKLSDAATLILERFVREARSAKSATVLASDAVDFDLSPTTTRFYLAGTDIKMRTSVGGTALFDEALDSPSVVVSSLRFTKYSITGTATSTAVHIDLGLVVPGVYASTTKLFQTTAVLRGSYE